MLKNASISGISRSVQRKWLILVCCVTTAQILKYILVHISIVGDAQDMFNSTHLQTHFINSRPLWISTGVNGSICPTANQVANVWDNTHYLICISNMHMTGWKQSFPPPISTHFTSDFLSHSTITKQGTVYV